MEIKNDTLYVKSTPENYKKEESGKKRNTIRKLSSIEKDGYDLEEIEDQHFIGITNTVTGELFVREITDFTIVGDLVSGYILISW